MKFTSEITVEVVQTMGDDNTVAKAAWASTGGNEFTPEQLSPERVGGVINYMVKHRHGTPFEHLDITFRVHAPIMVWREHHRHRIGFSYNEESGRYNQLKPVFWIPARERPLMQIKDPGEICRASVSGAGVDEPDVCGAALVKTQAGTKYCPSCGKNYLYSTSARPIFGPASDNEYSRFCNRLKRVYADDYDQYALLIELGYAKETARAILGVGIYSSCWVTCNARSLMHFLSLRTHEPSASFISYPQYEIERVARRYEEEFAVRWPLTYKAWTENGRVAP